MCLYRERFFLLSYTFWRVVEAIVPHHCYYLERYRVSSGSTIARKVVLQHALLLGQTRCPYYSNTQFPTSGSLKGSYGLLLPPLLASLVFAGVLD